MTIRVLLIDPDIAYIVTLKQALESTGEFRVSLAANFQAAEEALRHVTYHAVVMNFDLGETDPMAVIRMIRQLRPRLPVIITPTSESQHERVRYLDVQGALGKPFTARELIPYLHDVIAQAHGPVTTPPQDDVPDEYNPPQIPPAIQRLMESPDEAHPATPRGEIFNQTERDDIRGNLDLLDQPADETEPPQGEDLLAELEAFEHVHTGELDAVLSDEGEWETIPPVSDTLPVPDEPADEVPFDAGFLELPSAAGVEEMEPEPAQDVDDAGHEAALLEWATDPRPTATRPLTPPEEQGESVPDTSGSSGVTTPLEWEEEPSGTTPLETGEEPPDTTVLLEWAEPEETRRLASTDQLDTLIEEPGWDVVHASDSDGERSFPPPDEEGIGPADFGDVLDAVAQSSPDEYERSQRDSDFDELLDSLRTTEQIGVRRPRLEELLESIAADTVLEDEPEDAATTLDYVLEAIRRGTSPLPPDETLPPDIPTADEDDTTIGDVIDGLFEPSFEGVLAALAGEEVADTFEEPTYDAAPDVTETVEPDESDQIAPDEMTPDTEAPDWLADFDAGTDIMPEPDSAAPDVVETIEPPITEEDSRHYPATTVLSAVTGAEGDEDFSLSELLHEIEDQLPPVRARKPRLKPLPSWGDDTGLDSTDDIEALFDRMEGRTAPPPDEPTIGIAEVLPDTLAEPPLSPQDTRPTPIPSGGETDADRLSQAEQVPTVDPDRIFGGGPVATDAADLIPDELRELAADLPTDEPDESAQTQAENAIAEAFYAGVRETGEHDLIFDEAAAESAEAVAVPPSLPEIEASETAADDFDLATEIQAQGDGVAAIGEAFEPPEATPAADRTLEETRDTGGIETLETVTEVEAALELAGDLEEDHPLPPDDEHLIAVPAATVARLFEEEARIKEDETELAEIAVMLTQYSLESSAQATLLSRPNELLASAGDLPDEAIDRLFETVNRAWRTSPPTSDALIRFVSLPELGEYLLYSLRVEQDLTLSMIFSANTPVRTIRRQARRLSESLNLVPEDGDLPPVPMAERTLPSRPTDLRPPSGLHEAIAEEPAASIADADGEPEETGPYAGYTCLWLPHDPRLELRGDFADEIYHWIGDIAESERWHVHELDVQPDYVMLSLEIPQTTRPDSAITHLMEETAQRVTEYYPDVIGDHPLWADGYYFVAPPRALSDREIARFMTYQQQT